MKGIELKWIKDVYNTDEAPEAVGAYSQATAAGPLVYCSGMLGLIPGTKDFSGDDIEEQTKQAMENLAAVLEAAGSTLEMVLKTTVYLKSMEDFGKFNKVYGECFGEEPPARAAVEVSNLPLGALVEIEAVSLRD